MPTEKYFADRFWTKNVFICFLATIFLSFAIRMLEWPCWQNPEYKFGSEMLLATHDAYHWVAGACGFGRAAGHPMSAALAFFADCTGFAPAQIAFWAPAVLSSLVGGIVYLWGYGLGGRQSALAAGIIASISPGFLGRTLLGFYDTDLVTLFFPLLIALPPAWLLCKSMGEDSLFCLLRRQFADQTFSRQIPSPFLTATLAASGLLAFWTQEWHSVFPYVIRYDVFLIFVLGVCLVPRGQKLQFLSTALCFALPLALGVWGLLWPLCVLACAICCYNTSLLPPQVKADLPFTTTHSLQLLQASAHGRFLSALLAFLGNRWLLLAAWLLTAAFLMRGEILDTLLNQVNAYLKHTGDTHASGASSLVFPSVAQSIIEVQDLGITALFSYFHPWLEASALGFIGYLLVIWKRPAAMFLLPLAALGILSARLGGRMVMFGAPIVALGLCLPWAWFAAKIFARKLGNAVAGWSACCLLLIGLVLPFLDMIPALSQGPVLNRRHAAALAQAGMITPPDATLWLWWDWGYAAHYFARRNTICDGALHGGPSLYLPAAVFATDNPRFARQIIRRTSALDNEPGNFFRNLDAAAAQELMDALRLPDTPLITGKGRQFIVVSFEMLKLGFWISNFGNWNFITCQGEGGALSIVPDGLSYRLNAGEVRLDGKDGIIFPSSINIFAETGLIRRDYIREWFADHPNASVAQQQAWLASRRNVNFLFNRVTDEKLAMDKGIYDSLMVQLLLCDAHDPRFTPYFRLVYDNVFARVYEVLPQAN